MQKIVTCALLIAALFVGTSVFAQSSKPKAVDLGLSVKWADRNLGATSPEGYGDYYAWGETTTKSRYSWNNYKWLEENEYNRKVIFSPSMMHVYQTRH